jgi:uncharacterized membrane protein YphA (DoxX/SURF4 family)
MLALALSGLQIAIRAGMALLFLHSGLGKARDVPKTIEAIDAYQLVPDRLTGVAAVLLIGGEMSVGLSLLSGIGLVGGVTAGAALLLLFAVAMGANLMRGNTSIDCGCDPMARPQPLNWGLVARNLGLALLLLTCLFPAPRADLALWINAAAAGAITFILYLALTLLSSLTLGEAKARGAS